MSFQTQATLSAFISLVLYYAFFFFFEILQTIGLLIFNKCVALECEPKAQVSPLHGLQQILDSPIQNLALNHVEFL